MLDEISAAVLFLTRLVSRNGSHLDSKRLAEFGARLSTLLVERFDGHWFPERPYRGQGYRCIRVNEYGRQDPLLERAARDCGLTYEDLRLPVELTVWVDPEEVCCRFGEHKGSYCTVASFRVTDKENDKASVFHDELQSGDQQISVPVRINTAMKSRKTIEPVHTHGHQRVQQEQLQHSLNQDAVPFYGPARVQLHHQPEQHVHGIKSSEPQTSYCYLVPQMTHQSINRPVFGPEACSAGAFDSDQSYRRLDYTSFPLVASPSFNTQVSYSLHNDHNHWIERYPVHT